MKKIVKRVITTLFIIAMMMGLMTITAFAEDSDYSDVYSSVTVTVKWDEAEESDETVYSWCWGDGRLYVNNTTWPGDTMTKIDNATWQITIPITYQEETLGFITSCNLGQTIDLLIPSTGNVLITVDAEPDEYGKYGATVEIDGPEWEYEILDDQSVAIQKYLGVNTEIVIPDEIDGYVVKKIDHWAFFGNTLLSSITIPETVTEIGFGAFISCTSLSSITIPKSVNAIFWDTFKDCRSLSSITIPETVTSIGSQAFWGCTSLSSITIPETVTSIDSGAFENCTLLSSITIPSSVTKIYNNVFSGCTSLSSITIPETVTKIGNNVFSGCTSLCSITIPSSVTEIGECTFENCTSLSSVTIPTSLTEIGRDVFKGTKWLEDRQSENPYVVVNNILIDVEKAGNNLIIPEGVTSINNCIPSTVESITIPKSVREIGHRVFSGCTSLSNIIIPDTVTYIGIGTFENCTSLRNITIPTSVTEIGEYAFSDCTSLSSITIPSSVTEIGEYAFSDCTSLSSIIIPESVNAIWWYTFGGCTSLRSITIPETVKEICSGAFSGCTSLRSITIPTSVTKIGEGTFKNCTSLSSIAIPESVKQIDTDTFKDCTSLRSITIPETVTEIGSGAFSGCTTLSSITISEIVTEIGDSAFTGTKWLEDKQSENPYVIINNILIDVEKAGNNLVIPEGVNIIRCQIPETVESVIIPSSITKIEEGIFEYCTSLSSVTIPESVKYIGANAFSNTLWYENLNDTFNIVGDGILYKYNGENEGILVIPEGVKHICDGLFINSSFTSVILPGSLLYIGGNCFRYCNELNSIIVDESNVTYASYNGCLYSKDMKVLYRCPQAVSSVILHPSTEEIADGGFSECNKITEITLPANIKRLGEEAFCDCTELTKVVMTTVEKTDEFISFEANTFYGCNKFSTIEIPQTSQMYVINNGCLYSKDMTRLVMVPVANNNVILQDGLKVIGKAALAYNTSEKIIIPETVKLIEEDGIRKCPFIMELIFLGDAPEIEDGGIYGTYIIKFIPSPYWRKAFYISGSYEYNDYTYWVYDRYPFITFTYCIFTGLFETDENKIYYFKDGEIDKNFNGIAVFGNKYYVVEAGKVMCEFSGSWIIDSRGWKYQNADGTFAKTCWKAINSKWYYFDGEGYMQTGWKQINGNWYYLESSGAMATGWKQIDGSWYYFNNSGYMATGWLKDGGKWYYLESNGKMAANKWVDSVYYVKSNGAMAVSEWVDGGRYYVDSNGKWIPNKTKASWKKDAKGWWYDNGDGTYPKSTWKSIDGSWYYFNNSGYMATGWLNDGGKWYYLESNGRMASSKWIDGTYYVKANGVMATNEWVDGGRYYVDANGKWVANKTA